MDTAIRLIIAIPFGLVFGSFLTVADPPAPGEGVPDPAAVAVSHVRECSSANVDNIPVLSWVLLRGCCRGCGARISVVYPLTELATAGLFVAAALVFDDPWVAALMAPFLGILFAVAVIDLRHRIIPNGLMYPCLVIAPVYLVVARLAGAPVDLADAAIGFLAYGGGLLLIALISPKGMGMGDVKLAALVGLVLGALGLRYVAVAAGLGILIGGVAAMRRPRRRAEPARAGSRTGPPSRSGRRSPRSPHPRSRTRTSASPASEPRVPLRRRSGTPGC